MNIERPLLGAGAALLALILTLFTPVSVRRLNQAMMAVVISVLFLVAGLELLPFPNSVVFAVIASLAAIIYRDVIRFVKHVYWDVTKYSRRDYWYRRVGRTILGGRQPRRW